MRPRRDADGEQRGRALVVGLLVTEFVPDLTGLRASQIAELGTENVGPMHVAVGGAVGNVATALSALGTTSVAVAYVGDDELGRICREHLERVDAGLAERVRVREGEESSFSIVIAPSDADRWFWFHPGPNVHVGSDDVSDRDLERSDVLHLAYTTELPKFAGEDGGGLKDVLARAKAAGVTTSIDVTGRGGVRDYSGVFPSLDIFFPDLEEATALFFPEIDDPPPFDIETLRTVSGGLLDAGVAIVGLTLGDAGLYLRTSADETRIASLGRSKPMDPSAWTGRELYAAPRAVTLRSASAAGDTTIAAFIAALARGDSGPEVAASMAAAAGAWVVELLDTQSKLPTWEALRGRIARGWELRAPGVELHGWVETSTAGVWAPLPT